MAVLENLEPKAVFQFFEEISSVPRGTFYDEKISNWCVNFAKERNMEYIQDEAGNVIIKKPGTAGYEHADPVILQGHMDMVCEKTEDSSHDFEQEGLELYVEDGFVKAKDTTLGADNGIAMSFACALLDSKDIPHPPLEVIFTVDEEVGMGGANAIDLSCIKGTMLLNIDSEEEGTIIAGCAGGILETVHIPVERKTKSGSVVTMKIRGLRGGHSGMQIHEQRGNANKIAGRILNKLNLQSDIAFVEMAGGSKDNVIAAIADVSFVAADADQAVSVIKEMEAAIKAEFSDDEPQFEITVDVKEDTVEACTKESSDKVIFALMATPYGVQGLSRELEGLVESSLNLGIVATECEKVDLMFYIRSSVNSKMEEMKETIAAWANMLGGSNDEAGEYPAWMYQKESRIRPLLANTYKELFGKEPEITTLHAGIECGLLSGKKPSLDCVSFGPNLHDVHSVKEKLDIASTERTWKLIQAVLEKCK